MKGFHVNNRALVLFALGSVALGAAGCSFDQVTPYVAAGCAVGQAALATAQIDATAINKPKVAANIALAQSLAPTNCTAALAALQAAKAAAGK